jgi:hypothetical protein
MSIVESSHVTITMFCPIMLNPHSKIQTNKRKVKLDHHTIKEKLFIDYVINSRTQAATVIQKYARSKKTLNQ